MGLRTYATKFVDLDNRSRLESNCFDCEDEERLLRYRNDMQQICRKS